MQRVLPEQWTNPRIINIAQCYQHRAGINAGGHLIAVGLALGTGVTSGEIGSLPGQPPLTVVTWGGAFTRSQMQVFIQPYREARGRWVNVEVYNGGLGEIRAQVRSLNVKWDVVSLALADRAGHPFHPREFRLG